MSNSLYCENPYTIIFYETRLDGWNGKREDYPIKGGDRFYISSEDVILASIPPTEES